MFASDSQLSALASVRWMLGVSRAWLASQVGISGARLSLAERGCLLLDEERIHRALQVLGIPPGSNLGKAILAEAKEAANAQEG